MIGNATRVAGGESKGGEVARRPERRHVPDARSYDARDAADPFEERADELRGPLALVRGSALTRKLNARHEDISSVISGIDLHETPKTADEQTGPDEQHHRERRFGDEKGAARAGGP